MTEASAHLVAKGTIPQGSRGWRFKAGQGLFGSAGIGGGGAGQETGPPRGPHSFLFLSPRPCEGRHYNRSKVLGEGIWSAWAGPELSPTKILLTLGVLYVGYCAGPQSLTLSRYPINVCEREEGGRESLKRVTA